MIPVTVRGKHGRTCEILGEPTRVAGLVVTPVLDMHEGTYAGGFNLTHAPSGKGLLGAFAYTDPAIARELAERLHPIAPDWTGLPHHQDDWPADLRDAVKQVLGEHYGEVLASGAEFISRADLDEERALDNDNDDEWVDDEDPAGDPR